MEYTNASVLYPELVAGFKSGKVPYNTPTSEINNENLFLIMYNEVNDTFTMPNIRDDMVIVNSSEVGRYRSQSFPKLEGIVPLITVDHNDNENYKLGTFCNNFNLKNYNTNGKCFGEDIFMGTFPNKNKTFQGGTFKGSYFFTQPTNNEYRLNCLYFNSERAINNGSNLPNNVSYPYFMVVSSLRWQSDKLYATLNDVDSARITINNKITEIANNIINIQDQLNGQQLARVFDNSNQMFIWLNNPANIATLKVGYRFLILIGDSDYIWDGHQARVETKAELNLDGYYNKEQIENLLNDKVDKSLGKGLSTNDLTNILLIKIQQSITQNDLSSQLSPIENSLIEKEPKINKVSTFSDEFNTEDGKFPEVKAVINYTLQKTTNKADVKNLFVRLGDIKDLTIGNSVKDLNFDLKSFLPNGDSSWAMSLQISGVIPSQEEEGEDTPFSYVSQLTYTVGTNTLAFIDNSDATPKNIPIIVNNIIQPPFVSYTRILDIIVNRQGEINEILINEITGDILAKMDYGNNKQIDITNLNDRLNLIETTGIINGGSVDKFEETTPYYKINTVLVNIDNAGTGYAVGDKILSTGQFTGADRRIAIVVNEVGEDGEVISLTYSGKNVYFDNVAGTELDTNTTGQGTGLKIDITTEEYQPSLLSGVAKQLGKRVFVMYDETVNYNGRYYNCIQTESGLDWQEGEIADSEQRDFQIDPIKTYELEEKAVTTDKLSDLTVSTITENTTKIQENTSFIFSNVFIMLFGKINGIIQKFVDYYTAEQTETLLNDKQDNLPNKEGMGGKALLVKEDESGYEYGITGKVDKASFNDVDILPDEEKSLNLNTIKTYVDNLIFVGTVAEWNALPLAQKLLYKHAQILGYIDPITNLINKQAPTVGEMIDYVKAKTPLTGYIRISGTTIYLRAVSKDFPVGTMIPFSLNYIGSGAGAGEESNSFSRDTTNTSSGGGGGGGSKERWIENIAGYVVLSKPALTTADLVIGTVGITANGTSNNYCRASVIGVI
jgi:hypothetical protein